MLYTHVSSVTGTIGTSEASVPRGSYLTPPLKKSCMHTEKIIRNRIMATYLQAGRFHGVNSSLIVTALNAGTSKKSIIIIIIGALYLL
jgi:hypothetical protein